MALDIDKYLKKSTKQSGVPLKVQDAAVIEALAVIVNAAKQSSAQG